MIPRELAFFDLLDRSADGVVRGVVELASMIDDTDASRERRSRYASRIQELEGEGDELTHEILGLLNATFVTPFDRKDIHELASSLDDVLDSVDALADLLGMLEIAQPFHRFAQMVDVLQRCSGWVAAAVRGLRSLNHVQDACTEIRRLEREGDWLYRRGIAALYAGEYRAMDVLMWKYLMGEVESAIDRCEDIANTVEAVALKQL